MVDTARHFLPLDSLLTIVDTLPMNKFNTLHIHLSDAQSFPLDTPSAPEMIKGAFSPDLTYSLADLEQLKVYAQERGVRLVMEVDVPGHAYSFTAGYPQIMADCQKKYTNINNYALNPILDETFSISS